MNTLCSWSGGKDSCYALMLAKQQGYSARALLNVLNEHGQISRSHGIPSRILQAQAAAAGLPIRLIASSWTDYETNFTAALVELKASHQLTHAVFGDIDLQAHRDWEEKVCAHAGLTALLPLWQQDREALVQQMMDAGIRTLIISCNEKMGESFLGRTMNAALVTELKALDIDPCGENGEFHTLVTDCPLFTSPLAVEIKHTIKHDQYWFCEPVLL